jgi:hypothetical protein
MRRRGKYTKTLDNISSETLKGSSSKLLPDSTRRPRRYIWSHLFPLGHSDLLIINSRLRVSVGFSPTSPKRKQKLQPNFGCRKNLSANQLRNRNTLLPKQQRSFFSARRRRLIGICYLALPRSAWHAVSIGRYKEV